MANEICNIENLDISIYKAVYEEDLANILFHNTGFTHKIEYYKGNVQGISIGNDERITYVARVSGDGYQVKHFLICLNLLRNSGANIYETKNLETISNCFNMLTSILCYNRSSYSSREQILRHEYIMNYALSDEVKAFLFEYLDHMFSKTEYAGEDNEGLTYKSIHFCEA